MMASTRVPGIVVGALLILSIAGVTAGSSNTLKGKAVAPADSGRNATADGLAVRHRVLLSSEPTCERCLSRNALPSGCIRKPYTLNCSRATSVTLVEDVTNWLHDTYARIDILEPDCDFDLATRCPLFTIDMSSSTVESLGPGVLPAETLPRLRSVLLQGNRIRAVDDASFTGLNELRVVNLENNMITMLGNDAFTGPPKLHSLYLWGNPMLCKSTEYANGTIMTPAIQDCYGCVNQWFRPLLFVSTEHHQRCYDMTHLQILVLVIIAQIALFCMCHRTCMRPDTMAANEDDVELLVVHDVTVKSINF